MTNFAQLIERLDQFETKARMVRTPQGAAKFKVPIGSYILVRHVADGGRQVHVMNKTGDTVLHGRGSTFNDKDAANDHIDKILDDNDHMGHVHHLVNGKEYRVAHEGDVHVKDGNKWTPAGAIGSNKAGKVTAKPTGTVRATGAFDGIKEALDHLGAKLDDKNRIGQQHGTPYKSPIDYDAGKHVGKPVVKPKALSSMTDDELRAEHRSIKNEADLAGPMKKRRLAAISDELVIRASKEADKTVAKASTRRQGASSYYPKNRTNPTYQHLHDQGIRVGDKVTMTLDGGKHMNVVVTGHRGARDAAGTTSTDPATMKRSTRVTVREEGTGKAYQVPIKMITRMTG